MAIDNQVPERIELDKVSRDARLEIIGKRAKQDLDAFGTLVERLFQTVNENRLDMQRIEARNRRAFWITTVLVFAAMAAATVIFSADAGFIMIVALSFAVMRITTYTNILSLQSISEKNYLALSAMAECIKALHYHEVNTYTMLVFALGLDDAGNIMPSVLPSPATDQEQREG